MSVTEKRRARVRQELAKGDVEGLRPLAERLEAAGFAVEPEDLRADMKALGAVRVESAHGSVFAIPLDAHHAPPPPPKLMAEVSSDPDWKIQVGVVAVVAALLLVGFLGWLLG